MLAIERATRSAAEVEAGGRCAECTELEARGVVLLWCRPCGVGVEVADRWLGPRQLGPRQLDGGEGAGEGAEAPF